MDAIKAMEERRSHRYYIEDRRIPAETLEELFRLTSLAPSAYNLQPWEFILLQEKASKQKLYDNGCPQKQVLTSSAMLIVLGNKNPAAHVEEVMAGFVEQGYFNDKVKQKQIAMIMGLNTTMDDEEKRVWTMRSSVLACQQLMLAATALGLDSGPMEGFDAEKVRPAFEIPEAYELVMLISLGYREKEPLSRLPRRGYDVIVHKEGF